jgi:hypothetical protein
MSARSKGAHVPGVSRAERLVRKATLLAVRELREMQGHVMSTIVLVEVLRTDTPKRAAQRDTAWRAAREGLAEVRAAIDEYATVVDAARVRLAGSSEEVPRG